MGYICQGSIEAGKDFLFYFWGNGVIKRLGDAAGDAEQNILSGKGRQGRIFLGVREKPRLSQAALGSGKKKAGI